MTKKKITTLIILLAICLLSLAILVACSGTVTVPDEPNVPDESTPPDEPTQPVDPFPIDPEPDEPTQPVVPDIPTEPTEPTEPVVPDVPTEPTEPVVPDVPTDPTEPTEPVAPDVPTEPTEPSPPDVPIDPDDPVEPTTPPDTPVEPSPVVPPEEPPVLPQLNKPVVRIDASGIVFRPDEDASEYLVSINGDIYAISTVEELTDVLTQLTPRSYSVSIKAIAKAGYQDSEWSDEVDITAELWLPIVRNVVLDDAIDGDAVTHVVSWDAAMGANCYEVEVSKFVDDEWQLQGTFVVATPSYTLTYLQHGVYRLKIRAINDNSYILPSPNVQVGYTVDADGVVTLVEE